MPERPADEAFAQHVLKAGLVTEAQVQAAMREQAACATRGESFSIAQVLVRQAILTPALLENIERKLQTQREEAKRLGPYRILKKLGEGGMGIVYLAEDPATGLKVALKVLPKVAAREADAVGRFLREVDSARKLEHPNIVRASSSGEDKGFHYYVMEYVNGETLGERLKRQKVLPAEEATKMALQVALGLKYAHEQGFIHRDIKPDNVIVSKEGVAKILDMGLSKNIDEAQTFMTVTGFAVGTPHYIAPEQARGDKTIDGRADIYSLGATYYHLVTGETPFHGVTAIELITQHLNKQIPDPRDIRDGIPDGVVHIIRRMMAKNPQDRYRTCSELATDLELVLGGQSPSSQALEAARSAVALPMAREARERFRAQRRGLRPGTVRMTTKMGPSPAPLVVGGILAAVVLVVGLAVTIGGESPGRPGPPADTRKTPEPPKLRASDQLAALAKTPEELRQEEAQRKLSEIRAQTGVLAQEETRRRYGEFAKAYADTPQGKTIAAWLRDTEPKIAEAPKSENPQAPDPLPLQPVRKTPDPPPVEPPEKPPVQAAAIIPPRRSAVPDAAKQRDAESALKKAFNLDQAKTPKEKAELARTLLQSATSSGAKDAELYVLLRAAQNLAAQGMDAKTALEAIEAKASVFEVDALGEKVDLFAKTTVRGADGAAWAEAALDVAQAASEGDDYEAAAKLASRAEAFGRAANDRGLEATAKERGKEFADLKRAAESLKPHFKTLETKPDDPAANAAVGKFVSLLKGDWKRGLPMLAKGSDSAFKSLAEQELLNSAEPALQAALGEAWAAQAEKETPTYKARARSRSAEWLGRAILGLSGLAKVAAERKLASLGPAAGPKSQVTLDLGGGIRMELVYIKPGVFTMGGTDEPREGWQADERPEHKVTITRGFYLGKFHVTRGQFAAFIRATNFKTEAEREGKAMGRQTTGAWEEISGLSWQNSVIFSQTDEHPVICVTWNDAKAFCDWAAKKTGRGVRLATEAEWEYACRAGTKTRWPFGENDSAMGEYAWYNANSGLETHPVGQRKPNAWGLYDMQGNVWEWCQDWVGPYVGDAVDPTGPASGERRCLRGGGWFDDSPHCRAAIRGGMSPSDRITFLGFRVALP